MSAGHVDVHAHYLAPSYVDALRAAERWFIGGMPVPEWTPEAALEFMDRFGIERQFQDGDPQPALRIALGDLGLKAVERGNAKRELGATRRGLT